MSEDLKTGAPNVRAMPAWALMAGIASLGAIAIEAMHFGPALIVVILGGTGLLVGGWRCEALNQDRSASWPVRAAASLSDQAWSHLVWPATWAGGHENPWKNDAWRCGAPQATA